MIGYHAEMHGHIVRVAYDMQSALEQAVTFLPEVAVIDLLLGLECGFELALRLRRVPGVEHCRLVALSGLPGEHAQAGATQFGVEFDCQLTKPFDGRLLCEAIEGPPGEDLSDDEESNTRR